MQWFLLYAIFLNVTETTCGSHSKSTQTWTALGRVGMGVRSPQAVLTLSCSMSHSHSVTATAPGAPATCGVPALLGTWSLSITALTSGKTKASALEGVRWEKGPGEAADRSAASLRPVLPGHRPLTQEGPTPSSFYRVILTAALAAPGPLCS